MTSRTLPLLQIKAATVSTRSGTDPDEIDACHQVYGDDVGPFGEVIELCILSPVGQCQYTHHDGFENCIHCGKGDGVL